MPLHQIPGHAQSGRRRDRRMQRQGRRRQRRRGLVPEPEDRAVLRRRWRQQRQRGRRQLLPHHRVVRAEVPEARRGLAGFSAGGRQRERRQGVQHGRRHAVEPVPRHGRGAGTRRSLAVRRPPEAGGGRHCHRAEAVPAWEGERPDQHELLQRQALCAVAVLAREDAEGPRCGPRAPGGIQALQVATPHDGVERGVGDLCVADAEHPQPRAVLREGLDAEVAQPDHPAGVEDLEVRGARRNALDRRVRDRGVGHAELLEKRRRPGLEALVGDLGAAREVQGLEAEAEQQLRGDLVRDRQAAVGQAKRPQVGRPLHDVAHEAFCRDLSALPDRELLQAQEAGERPLPQSWREGAVGDARAVIQPQRREVLAVLQHVADDAVVHLLARAHVQHPEVRAGAADRVQDAAPQLRGALQAQRPRLPGERVREHIVVQRVLGDQSVEEGLQGAPRQPREASEPHLLRAVPDQALRQFLDAELEQRRHHRIHIYA
mmetsp:Transcript_11681/g.25585  ORF Transcript_11681/g.25585 Transcript_11681/m.25585 type:complete len:488 (+) Transcript_11681:1103-2566(+)